MAPRMAFLGRASKSTAAAPAMRSVKVSPMTVRHATDAVKHSTSDVSAGRKANSLPSVRRAQMNKHQRRHAEQLELETKQMNDSLRFLESIGLSPRRAKLGPQPPAYDIGLGDDDDDDDDILTRSKLRRDLSQFGSSVDMPSRPSSGRSLLLGR